MPRYWDAPSDIDYEVELSRWGRRDVPHRTQNDELLARDESRRARDVRRKIEAGEDSRG